MGQSPLGKQPAAVWRVAWGFLGGEPLAIPADRRTSRYAEHRRLGSGAVAQSRSAPTHANVRLSPNGRAGVFIRAWQAEISPLPGCREENSSHQGLPSRIKIPSRGTNKDYRCASSVGPTRECPVRCGFPPFPGSSGENKKGLRFRNPGTCACTVLRRILMIPRG